MKTIIKTLKVLGIICTPATVVLAVLWFLQPEKNYEPITVALGGMSIIFFAVAQFIQQNYTGQVSEKIKFDELTPDEILKIVSDSSPDEWDVSLNAEIAVYKRNPSIRIETRHTDEFVHNGDFYEKWANKFSDPHAASYYYHLYLGATRLKEFILVSVDGGRALLPLPKYATDLSVEPLRYKYTVK